MTDDDKARVEVWYYGGRRRLQSGGLGDAWYAEDGTPVGIYKKFPGMAIGRPHYITIPEPGVVLGRPDMLADAVSHGLADEWALADRAAWTADVQRKREAKAKKEGATFGRLTLDECRHMLDNAGPNRHAMLAQILRHLGA